MNDQEMVNDTQPNSLASFKEQVQERIRYEEAFAVGVEWDPRKRRIGLAVAVGLVAVSFIAILLNPSGWLIWLLVSFIMVCFSWLLLFLPTTRREKGFWRNRRAIVKKSKGSTSKSIKFIAKRRKRLLSEVWINAFFYGNAIPTFAFLLIFGISVFFALYHGYVSEDASLRETWIVVFQCIAIIGFHAYLYYYKPYAKSMFSLPKDFKGKMGRAQNRNSMAVAGVILFIALFIALFSFFIVLGMLLPGTTLDKVRAFLSENGGANTVIIVVVVVIQYAVLRFFQSITSAQMMKRVVANQLRRLRENVLAPLDMMISDAAQGKTVDANDYARIKAEYYQICINRVFRHDYFGKLPMFFINPDMKLLMREDVLEVLEQAGGTG